MAILSRYAAGDISIHALREEGDYDYGNNTAQIVEFLSTPSARRATFTKYKKAEKKVISIHALREEGDPVFTVQTSLPDDFYPRPPRGGRRCCVCSLAA